MGVGVEFPIKQGNFRLAEGTKLLECSSQSYTVTTCLVTFNAKEFAVN